MLGYFSAKDPTTLLSRESRSTSQARSTESGFFVVGSGKEASWKVAGFGKSTVPESVWPEACSAASVTRALATCSL
jgi:hypothetical protein